MPFSNFRTHHPMEDTYGSLYTLWRKQFLACRSRENGMSDRLHRKNNGKCCARKDCPRNYKYPTKPLPREVGYCFSIQSPKSISSLLEGKVCRSSPILSMYLVNTMGVATSQVPRFSGNNLIQSTCTIKRTHRR
jgi:hypothetical protein